MCGRYTLIKLADFTDIFPWIHAPASMPNARYNIAPSQPVAVVANDGKNTIQLFRWGLVPSWAKEESIGNRTINARAETLADKPMFHTALKRRRCLIPADGFYEWKKSPDGKSKTPMYIHMKGGKPFAFAGLWDRWHSPDGSELLSCTIVTGKPNKLCAENHDRMPMIVTGKEAEKWIKPGEMSATEAGALLKSYPAEEMEAFAVSRRVNNPGADLPDCVKPVVEVPPSPAPKKKSKPRARKKDEQGTLF